VPAALLDFARAVNATQLVLGTSRRSRLARVFDEGIGAAVVQASGPIDVHMVTHDEAARGWRIRLGHSALTRSRHVLGWVLAPALPGLVTLAGHLWREELTTTTNVVDYFLVLAVVALVGGIGPALVTAVLGALLLNYFFIPPVYFAQLRRKLEPDPSRPRHLITEARLGYRLET
jgi:two-component system, OmpR family, sensor histidine kinase KdpD